ncbi:MAG TPA: hypothetical protein VF941_03000 [Clostridia bacterium]
MSRDNYQDLLARNLVGEECFNCNGRGTYFDNTPVGAIKQLCFICHGTGKKPKGLMEQV